MAEVNVQVKLGVGARHVAVKVKVRFNVQRMHDVCEKASKCNEVYVCVCV